MSNFETENNNQDHESEKKENIEKLHNFSGAIAQENNQKYEGGDIVNEDITINIKNFDEDACYTKEEIEEDEKFVERKKKKFNKEELRDSNGQLFEEAIACVFHRILKKNYLVVRSSDFDDFSNGVDLLIVDEETGEIICAVDDISTNENFQGIEDKENKVLLQNMNGGAKMKYGLTFKENGQSGEMELTREKIKEIPIFFMHLSGEKLDELLSKMNYDIKGDPSEIELEIFDELVRILEIESKEMQKKIQERFKESSTEIEKMKIEDDIKNLENDIENFAIKEKHKNVSLKNLKETENLFKKMKKIRNEEFPELEA